MTMIRGDETSDTFVYDPLHGLLNLGFLPSLRCAQASSLLPTSATKRTSPFFTMVPAITLSPEIFLQEPVFYHTFFYRFHLVSTVPSTGIYHLPWWVSYHRVTMSRDGNFWLLCRPLPRVVFGPVYRDDCRCVPELCLFFASLTGQYKAW